MKKGLEINFNVHDGITCLNRNLKTHIVRYLGKDAAKFVFERSDHFGTLTINPLSANLTKW